MAWDQLPSAPPVRAALAGWVSSGAGRRPHGRRVKGSQRSVVRCPSRYYLWCNNAHAPDATVRCYSPDLTTTINGAADPNDRDAFIEGLREQWRGFLDSTVIETSRITLGNAIITEMVVNGRNTAHLLNRPPTGKRWHSDLAWVCTLPEGQVAVIRTYIDHRSLLEAAGS